MNHYSTLFLATLILLLSSTVHAFNSIQPPAHVVAAHRAIAAKANSARNLHANTNAARFARGLPPLPPRAMRRHGSPTTPLEDSYLHKRKKPAPSPIVGKKFKGVIKATKKDGTVVGYVGKDFQVFGEYGPVSDISDALQVSISGLRPGLNGPLNVKEKNGDSKFSFVGGIAGFANNNDKDNLKSNSFNYAYVGGTKKSAEFSPPDDSHTNAFTDDTGIPESSESAIWIVDTQTAALTAEWINPNGDEAKKTQIAFFEPDNVFVLVGDIKAFEAEFGPTDLVTFTLISD